MKPSSTQTKIEHSAAEAIRIVADAALEATKLVASNAAEAVKVSAAKGANDHDTLISLVSAVSNLDQKFTEKFADIRSDIKDLKDGTSQRIEGHESRLCLLESSKTRQNVMMSIGIGILGVLVSLLIYHIVH